MNWKHALNWFEIPAADLDRAFQFYHNVLNGRVRRGTLAGNPLLLFDVPFGTGEAVGGSIVLRPEAIASGTGPVVYLNTFGTLQDCLARVEASGGKLLSPIQDLGAFGKAAWILDSEGNTLGLHQQNEN